MRLDRDKFLWVFSVSFAALLSVFVGQSVLVPTESVSADTATAVLTANVHPIISMSTEGTENGALPIEIDRAAGANMGTGKVIVKVSTNDPDGYSLYITTDKADTTLSQDGVTDRIKALEGETKKANFPENSWGYSIDGGANYKPVQADTYNPDVNPDALETAEPARTYGSATTDNQTEVTIGAKVKSVLPSGVYSNTVVFTAIPNTDIAWAIAGID